MGTKLNRTKAYDYLAEYMLKHGEPADNMSNIKADFDEALTRLGLAITFLINGL